MLNVCEVFVFFSCLMNKVLNVLRQKIMHLILLFSNREYTINEEENLGF